MQKFSNLFLSYSTVYKCVFTCSEHYLSEFDVLGDAYRGNVAAQNLAYLLFNKAERVGCAVASNCSAGNSVVICKFQPTLEFMTSEPFR